jgi:UDPglucose 6-dehydrogenase
MKQLYTKWIPEDKIILVDSNTSELSKLVSNAFLGQRISSINSITALCESTNSDVNKLTVTVGSDSRIGKNFLKASMGFGGSCLKKDILSLVYILSSRNLDLEAQYWANVIIMNEYQRLRVCNVILKCYEKIKEKFNLSTNKKEEDIKIRTFENLNFIENKNKKLSKENSKRMQEDFKVNVFGLSFKGNTNDIRGANSVFLVNFLIKKNIKVNLFDPYVKKTDFENELKIYNEDLQEEFIKENLCFYTELDYYQNLSNALEYGMINVFCNDHKEFKDIDFDSERRNNEYESDCEDKFIFDLYDVFCLEKLEETNYKIYKLGVVNEIENYN